MAFAPGDWVRLARRPQWADRMPPETQQIIDACVGKVFRIGEVAAGGLYVLDVSDEIDARFGGCLNDLRVEAEFLEPANGPP